MTPAQVRADGAVLYVNDEPVAAGREEIAEFTQEVLRQGAQAMAQQSASEDLLEEQTP